MSNGRIAFEPAFEPHDGSVFAVYTPLADDKEPVALGRRSNAWTTGPCVPFPNAVAANAAVHAIPVPQEFR